MVLSGDVELGEDEFDNAMRRYKIQVELVITCFTPLFPISDRKRGKFQNCFFNQLSFWTLRSHFHFK
jgi:hypothetical protein